MTRRDLLFSATLASLWREPVHAAVPFPVQFRQQPPYAPLLDQVMPGKDEFTGEKLAMETADRLREAVRTGALTTSINAVSPEPEQYAQIAPDVRQAVYGKQVQPLAPAWKRWCESLGQVSRVLVFPLPEDRVRYEISSQPKEGGFAHRVGLWRQRWQDGKLVEFSPLEETLVSAPHTRFRDVTATLFAGVPSFQQQLARGVPYWRSRLDSAVGIDLYGSNGVAVGDIDNDGWDEIYVCQPGGLPNRLYRNHQGQHLEDITAQTGTGILDDTSSALFLDLRNTGRQDLVVLRSGGPVLFLNQGDGRFVRRDDAFHFATPPQGGFTGMAAADYDRDGRLDLYLCCYVYFQSEAQYRYPVPYHDAQNGPPNFLFRNRLNADGSGHFEDVTDAAGLDHNNNRFSFAPAWCDDNGDGWPDLYVANDFGRNNLYRNSGGRFRDVAREAGVEDIAPGMSAAWFDEDGDGRPDLYVANMWSDAGQRVTRDPAFTPASTPDLKEAYRRHTKGNSLFHNNGDGTFADVGAQRGVEMGRWAWSADAHDFDNDGLPEILTTCGMLTNESQTDLMSYFWRQVVARSPVTKQPAPAYENGWNAINQLIREEYSWSGREPNVCYVRRGDRYFDFSGVSGFDYAEDSRAFAVTDLHGDGNLDVILKSRLGPQVRLLQNQCTEGRTAIAFSLRGVRSNRDAIGARVEVDGQVKWLSAGSGYLSQHTKRMHFGLKGQRRAEKVSIVWPSGLRQALAPLEAGYCYVITEGSVEFQRTPFRAKLPLSSGEVAANNSLQLEDTWFWEPIPLPEQRRGPALLVVRGSEPVTVPSGSPVQQIDLTREGPDTAASYALFRRYLFDWRTGLRVPLLLLIDEAGCARKIYGQVPSAERLRADLGTLNKPLPDQRALPFPGEYVSPPGRDYYKLGAALMLGGYPEHALPYLTEMLRRSPHNARTLFAIGRVHFQANRIGEARQALKQAVEADPAFADAWNELGGVEMATHDERTAFQHYQRALQINSNLPYALQNAAQTAATLGDTAQAEALYQRALQADPKSPEVANGLGLLLAKQGRTDEARQLFQQAISLRRNYSGAINNLGVLYLQSGQPNDAIAAFQYGIEAAPEDDVLYLNLGRVYVQIGERDKARAVMQRLLARKPGSEIARKALQQLDTP